MCELCDQVTDEQIDAACARFEQAADAVRPEKLPRAAVAAWRKGEYFLGIEGLHSAVLGLRVVHRRQRHLFGYTAGKVLSSSVEELRDDLEEELRGLV